MSQCDWSSVCASLKQEILLMKLNLMMLLLCVDRHWNLLYGQDTGRGTGIFERRSGAAVVTEMSITEDLATTDLHMSAVGLSVTSIVPHHTVCLVPHLLRLVFTYLSSVW